MNRLMSALVVLICFVLGAPVAARAQEATPVASGSECMVETRNLLPLFREMGGTPQASPPVPVAATTPPTGIPADEATVAEVTATVNEFAACFSAGYRYRYLYLLSNDFLRVSLGDLDPAELEAIAAAAEAESGPATPTATAGQTLIQEVRDVQVLADTRVIATVIGGNIANVGGATPVYFIFVRNGDRFLIDDIIPSQPQATPPA